MFLISELDRNFYTTLGVGIILFVLLAVICWLFFFNKKVRIAGGIRKLVNASTQYIRYTNIIKSSQFVKEAIVTIDSKGLITYTNNRVKDSFKYSEDELEGKTLDILFVDETQLEQFEKFKTFNSGTSDEATLITEVMRKDGIVVPVEINISKWHDEDDDRGVYFTVVIRDISHRIKNEKAVQNMREEIDRHTKITSHAMDLLDAGGWHWNIVDDLVSVDEGGRKAFGLRRNETEIKAADLTRLIHYKDREKVNSAILNATVGDKQPYEISYGINQPDGSVDFYRCIGEPVIKKNETRVKILRGALILIKKNYQYAADA